MKFAKTLLFFLAVFFYQIVGAQDIHWTMYDMSPLTLNPANTGAFEGTFRIGGIYRDQMNVSGITGYRTPSFYIDAPIIKGFGKNDWVGVGGVFYNDQSGVGQLTNQGFLGSASYHLGLGKKGTSVLTLGVQGGMISRTVEGGTTLWTFQRELSTDFGGQGIPQGSDPDRERLGDKSYLDINAGLLFSSQLNKTTTMKLGLGFKHINQPEYGFFTNFKEKLPMRIQAHGTFDVGLSEKWMLSPSFLFSDIETMNQGAVQVLLGYHFNKDLTLKFGPGYRVGRNMAVIVGLDYKTVPRRGIL